MTSITYVGMDVHTTNYTLCAYNNEEQRPFAEMTINPDIKELVKYLDNLEKKTNGSKIVCGYEAGCLGYTLYHQLTAKGRKCILLAPTKIPSLVKEIKTDKTHTAMSLIVEIGDFKRFPTAQQFSAFLGLVPGEHSSSTDRNRLSITKAGNSHLRRLLTESANSYSRTYVGKKSKDLKKRQQGNTTEVIAYADKANDRLRRKYMRITRHSNANIAKIAIARELACFVWGMMNDKLE